MNFRVGLLILLNTLDAVFTVYWIQNGLSEGNPVMAWVLRFGVWPFLVVKVGLVNSIACLIARFKAALTFAVCVYLTVLWWHLYLFLTIL